MKYGCTSTVQYASFYVLTFSKSRISIFQRLNDAQEHDMFYDEMDTCDVSEHIFVLGNCSFLTVILLM